MNNALLEEVEAVRRLSSAYGRWRGDSSGRVLGPTNLSLADCFGDPSLAVYLARLHNVFTLLANATLDLRRRLNDREAMTQEMSIGKTEPLPRRRVPPVRRNPRTKGNG